MGDEKTALTLLLILCLIFPNLSLPLVSAAEDTWTTLEPKPTARNGLGVAVVDGKIYAIGGAYSGHNEMYDPATDTWTIKKPMPTPRAYFGIAVYQNKIYCIGGETAGFMEFTGVNEVYDPATDTWETKTSMSPRGRICANVVEDKIYLIAGIVRATPYATGLVGSNAIYDPKTDSWTTGAYMPNFARLGLEWLTSVVVDNKIYIMYDSDYQVYDPETDTWSSGTLEPVPSIHIAAGATSGKFAPKRIHLLRGNAHQIYDPVTDTWTEGTPIPTTRWLFGVAVVNDELYAIGGYNGTTILAVNEKYTPIDYIPEFPSWIILPLFLTVTLVVIFFRRRLK